MSVRLERHASLTLAALGPECAGWIGDYQHHAGEGSALGFLEFVIAHTGEHVLLSLARFERALLVARYARDREDPDTNLALGPRLCLHPAARTIDLPGPADQVIAAVSLGLDVLPYAGWPVLVAPGLPTLWRKASPIEDALCTWLTRPRNTSEVLARFPGGEHVLPSLLAARALVSRG
ncbi:MAG: hypothetical protein AAF799_44650 [Myxococcota bacterium]